jgi:hypothetical protein
MKVRVIKIEQKSADDQYITIDKVYEAWDLDRQNSVSITDDNGKESALFDGEWELVDA